MERFQDYFKNPKHQLAKLVDKVNLLRRYNQSLYPIIGAKLAEHCEIVDVKNNCLTIITDSAAWATKIRFQTPEILEAITQKLEFQDIRKIKCLIRTKEKLLPQKKSRIKNLRLSKNNAEIILSTADGIKNPKLKNVLAKIAAYGE